MYAFTLALPHARRWLLLPLAVLGHGVAAAQAPATAPADTTTRHVLPAVEVQASRPAQFAAGSRFTSLDSLALAPYRAATVAEALAARTPLYLKAYGPGQLASLSIRGTSARHTAVLWHGFSLNFPTLGEADFSLLPVAAAGRIDVQHGPAAAQYGSGAVGGAVVLGEHTPAAGTMLSVLAEAGSFGSRALEVSGSQRDERVTLRTSFSHRIAQNDFSYFSPEFGGDMKRRQENAAVQQTSFMQDMGVQLGRRDQLVAALWLTDALRQIQPAMGSANRHGRERDQSARLVLGYRHRSALGETSLNTALLADNIEYSDDNLRTSHSESEVRQAHLEHTFRTSGQWSLRLGSEAQQFVARVDGYGRPITEWRFAGFGLLRYDPTARLRLSLNARQAMLPGERPGPTPTLGVEWEALESPRHQLWLKGNVARSYRAPTLNERYWKPGGNPNLLPETGLGYEGGLRYVSQGIPGSRLSLQGELTGYRLEVDNWVQWTPDPLLGVWSPRNLRRVRSQGLETSAQAGWSAGQYRLTGKLGYAFTQTRKTAGTVADEDPTGVQLPYVPLHSANVSADQQWRGWTLGSSIALAGYRYTDASATSFLPGYAVLNASGGYTLSLAHWQLTALVQGYNLTNTAYQTYAYRAMPLRAGALSLRVSWH